MKLIMLKLNTLDGKPLLVCANKILWCHRIIWDAAITCTEIVMGDDCAVNVRESLEEIARMVE